MNEKLTKLKKKVKENAGSIAFYSALTAAAATAVAIHKANRRLEESNQDLEKHNMTLQWTVQMLRTVGDAVDRANETGRATTIVNEDDKPLFKISPVND